MADRFGTTDLITAVSHTLRRTDTVNRRPASTLSDERQLAETVEQQRSQLRELRRAHDELTKKVDALEKRSRSLLGVLDQVRDWPQQRQALQSQLTSARIQQVAGVVGNVQAAAFGDAGSVFTRNNLLLAGNQLFWIFLDPLLRSFGAIGGTGPSIATWLAPVGTLVGGQLVLGNRQHVRFISDVATVTPGQPTFVPLRDRIADGSFEEFQRRTNVAVSTALLDDAPVTTFGEVAQGVLRVGATAIPQPSIPSPPGGVIIVALRRQGLVPAPVRVAWVIDTGIANG